MEMFTCPVCGKSIEKENTDFTYDVNGIPLRRVCMDCFDYIMNYKGYDGRDYRNDHTEEIEEIW